MTLFTTLTPKWHRPPPSGHYPIFAPPNGDSLRLHSGYREPYISSLHPPTPSCSPFWAGPALPFQASTFTPSFSPFMMLFAAQFARLSSANGLGSWENWSIERQDGCIIKSCQLTLARYAAVCNMKVVDSLQHRTRRGSQLHLHLEVVSSLWQGMRRWFLFGQRPQRGDVL